MSEVLANNTVMVEMVYAQGVLRMENVFHVLCPGVPTSGDIAAIFTVFDAWERNNARAQRSNQIVWTAYRVRSIHVACHCVYSSLSD